MLKRTPLHPEHVALGAKMAPFAGFEMPVHYAHGIRAEHEFVRSGAGLFDVSHMGEIEVAGPDALECLQFLTVNDVSALEEGQAQYSALCREDGGVLDDFLVYRLPDRYLAVVNAGNRERAHAWILERSDAFDVRVEDRSDAVALLALQGPRAQDVLAPLADADLSTLGYYRCRETGVCGTETLLSRTGYTGEDGFELYMDAAAARRVWREILASGDSTNVEPSVRPTGLGARDSLRLEMGYALYGQDLDEERTPLEAGLGWITKLDKGDFVGREALCRQTREGVDDRLVGIRLLERAFPRSGYGVRDQGAEVGHITSGTVSPSLGHGIALAYVHASLAEPGTELSVRIRDRDVSAEVVRPPFYREGSIRR